MRTTAPTSAGLMMVLQHTSTKDLLCARNHGGSGIPNSQTRFQNIRAYRFLGAQRCPSPGDLPNPGIEPRSPALQADSLPTELPGKPFYCAAAAQSLQSCPTLCSPIDSSPPGSTVPGILQARTLCYMTLKQTEYGRKDNSLS